MRRGPRRSARPRSSGSWQAAATTRLRVATCTPRTPSTRTCRRSACAGPRFSTYNRKPMRLALAQIDPVVGDLDGNRELILGRIEEARTAGADLVVLPELAVTGYPPEDLLLRPSFVSAARASIERIAAETREIVALVGVPIYDGGLYNACAVCADGAVIRWVKKWHLPNYGVFDEKRYFVSGDEPGLVEVAGTRVGVTICGAMW